MKDGFPTRYKGGGEFIRDYASPMGDEEEAKAIEKAYDCVSKGWAAGPFDIPPFPNSECDRQAIVTKSFTIPKHKWLNDGALRLIFHKSFPLGHSVNSITPRHDAATYFPKGSFKYFTISQLLTIITKAGRGCLLTQFDARDAYKQLLVQLRDLNQQIFKAGGKYFVDFCASFGSLYGNDAYSTFAYAHCFCLSRAANCPLLSYYVDNYINVTPFCGSETKKKALVELLNLKRELITSGLLFHQFEGPTTKITFLGWDIDTEKMTISIPEARYRFMISFLEEWEKKETMTIADLSSLIGLLIFLAQMINGLKNTIGTLILKRNKMNKSTTSSAPTNKRVRWAIAHILYVLKRWGGVLLKFMIEHGQRNRQISLFIVTSP